MKIHTISQFNNSAQKIIHLPNELVTISDLQNFRLQLLKDLKHLLSNSNPVSNKKWLKSSEVRKLLNVSSGTLQTLRSNGTLRYNKVGGIIYYQYEDIDKMIEGKSML